MHFLKRFCIMTFLGALGATTAASPAPFPPIVRSPIAEVTPIISKLQPRVELEAEIDRTAIVNNYSGDSCDGNSFQFTVVGAGSSACHAVEFDVGSIQVSAKYVYPCLIILIWPFRYLFSAWAWLLLVAVPQVFGVVTTVRVIREGFRTRAVLGFSMDLFWLSARGHKRTIQGTIKASMSLRVAISRLIL